MRQSIVTLAVCAAVLCGGTARARGQCVGDCSGSGAVAINDLITMVNIALGTGDLSACRAGDADNSDTITINEIIAAVNNALSGCPPSRTSCSCTQAERYWSATSIVGDFLPFPSAWGVFFRTGEVEAIDKASAFYVRAVRGGS